MPKSSTLAQRKYDAANCKFYHLKFNLRTDADVIAKLESVRSKQDYIRKLIRKDNEEEATMEKTLYTAIIENDEGIHLIRKAIADPTAEYEDFEYAMQNKAEELGGELYCIYDQADIVEDITLD